MSHTAFRCWIIFFTFREISLKFEANRDFMLSTSNSRSLRITMFLKSKTFLLLSLAFLIFVQFLCNIPGIGIYFYNNIYSILYSVVNAVVICVVYSIMIFVLFIQILRFRIKENFHIVRSISANLIIMVIGLVFIVIFGLNTLAIFLIENVQVGAGLYWINNVVDAILTLLGIIDFTM